MSKPIAVGDLVMVIRSNGCKTCQQKAIGKIFRVVRISNHRHARDFMCSGCGKTYPILVWQVGLHIHGERSSYPEYRLIRIDPPAIPESTETREEITV